MIGLKKSLRIVRILIIAMWPVVFLLSIGSIELHLKTMASQTFNLSYQYWTAVIYAVSGCLFAVSGFYRKEDSDIKSIVVAYVIAGVSVALFFIVWLISYITGFLWNAILQPVTLVNLNNLALVFAYTLFSAIRAIVLDKKRG